LEPRFEINPDLIVAMGAAVQGGVLAGEKLPSILVDITPHTFSTSALQHDWSAKRLVCVPIIPRNTPLPAGKAELFATCYDNETEIKVTAYQGEAAAPEENSLIGDFLVEGLSRVPAGNQVIIHFDLDLNGMLKVTATEKATGLAKTVTMDTRGARTLDLELARRNIASLVGEPEAAPAGAAAEASGHPAQLAAAKGLRKRAEALLQKNISPDDATELRKLLHDSAEAISASVDLTSLNEALEDLLFYLED
jgi:molecular chaperone DnaK